VKPPDGVNGLEGLSPCVSDHLLESMQAEPVEFKSEAFELGLGGCTLENKGQWSEIVEVQVCRLAVGKSSSHSVVQKALSIRVIIGCVWGF
jgi:hypothetical protein